MTSEYSPEIIQLLSKIFFSINDNSDVNEDNNIDDHINNKMIILILSFLDIILIKLCKTMQKI